jgi:glutamine amidotransferase
MEALRSSKLEPAALIPPPQPFLGSASDAALLTARTKTPARGLSIVPGAIRAARWVKHPQMQWNVLDVVRPTPCSRASKTRRVYFVPVRSTPDDPEAVVATCDYGGAVVAAVESRNVFATKFHPEKSSTADSPPLELR